MQNFIASINPKTKKPTPHPKKLNTIYADEELVLIYHNYRHYNSADGRWINRDPIMEQGGWNLYAFLKQRLEDNTKCKVTVYQGGVNAFFPYLK